ncbi:hypothetical protein C2U72_00105, partial [Prosthecomicrobium hirschii]
MTEFGRTQPIAGPAAVAAANASTAPVLPRDPSAPLPGDLPRGADLPEDHDPLAEGVLMKHQAEWLADTSDLKLAEKGRRTGITYAEALDSAMTAAAARSAGGQNVFYIGDTRDKGREYIGYVAHFARVVAAELAQVEEFLFDDLKEDGGTKQIAAFRIRFASGFRVEALSSRPENIRGLQGTVVIDEAAFHRDVREVLDAVNALLIWGGRIRVISSHNGVLNPFNELIREAKAGKVPFSVHHIPFGEAVRNGLYRRVCLMTAKTWSPAAEAEWEAKIRGAYGARQAAMRQELDAIPADAEGAALTRVQIEAAAVPDIPIVRIRFDDDFKGLSPELRKTRALALCLTRIKPVLDRLNPTSRHVFGEDFARTGDVTAIWVWEIDGRLRRVCRLIVEIRNGPFDQQREILFYVGDGLPRFAGGKLDATGNGAYLAEVAAQKWGASRIEEVKLSVEWYATHMPPYIDAIADRTAVLPMDEDVIADHQALQFCGRV